MFHLKYPTQQSEPPLSPRETLPTMYDLPSEDPEEPGLPDEFHDYQPEIMRRTFRPRNYYPNMLFAGSDINIYYDVHHHNWYKCPDWFGVVGVPRLYNGEDLRLSYVVWQEGVNPFVVVELLSPGTEKEDLGKTERKSEQPPTKWEVYEQILRVPYYVVFNRYNDELRVFTLQADRYQELSLTEPKVWMPKIELGLGLWRGVYEGLDRLWLRWYDAEGDWILTEEEAAQQRVLEAQQRVLEAQQRVLESEQRTLEAQQRAEELARRLRDLGVDL
jgi:Uma2 family endonuclease